MSESNEIYLNFHQAMAVFGRSRRCIQYWASTGVIRQVKKGLGRGNQSVFAFPPVMMPAGYREVGK